MPKGYAVLQPAFRGSRGYGEQHTEAGFGQWGQLMQQDVIDGRDWLVATGVAAPDKICIFGASYGGYVALVASYQSPDRFVCAVSFAGVADLPLQIQNLRRYDALQGGTIEQIKPKTMSVKQLEEYSPAHNAAKMALPLLLVQGDIDRRVRKEQAQAMTTALDKANKPYQIIWQAGGDHYLSRNSHRQEFFNALDSFLSEYLD